MPRSGISWTRGLVRGFNEFAELHLAQFGHDVTSKISFDQSREIMHVRFKVRGVDWRISVETPAETAQTGKGSCGRIVISDGPAQFEGPIDVTTWNEIGRLIREKSKVESAA